MLISSETICLDPRWLQWFVHTSPWNRCFFFPQTLVEPKACRLCSWNRAGPAPLSSLHGYGHMAHRLGRQEIWKGEEGKELSDTFKSASQIIYCSRAHTCVCVWDRDLARRARRIGQKARITLSSEIKKLYPPVLLLFVFSVESSLI